jgi:hypothetical protein
MYCYHLHGLRISKAKDQQEADGKQSCLLFDLEEGGDTFFPIYYGFLQNYTVLQHRRWSPSQPPLREPQIKLTLLGFTERLITKSAVGVH